MIQRIQSVYLFLIVVVLAFMELIPLAEISADGLIFDFTSSGLLSREGHSNIALLPIGFFIALLMIYNVVIVFLYKNRVLQIKLAKLNGILLAVLIAVVVMSADYVSGKLGLEEAKTSVDYSVGTYISFFPLIFNYLAVKAIKKDEELVRSADRLR